jgi:G3E family GTPase
MDEEVQRHFRLDGIVTMVDAKHVSLHLDDSPECQQQIAFADVLILNKMDLVSKEDAARLEQRIHAMNSVARVHRATNAEVDIAAVLDVGGFDLKRALATKPAFLEPEYPFEWGGLYALNEGLATLELVGGADATMQLALVPASDFASGAETALRTWARPTTPLAAGSLVPAGKCVTLAVEHAGPLEFTLQVPKQGRWLLVTEHHADEYSLTVKGQLDAPTHRYGGHAHDETVTSVGLHFEGKVDPKRFNAWLGELLRTKGTDLFRSKGILNIAGEKNRFVFQGVHMLFDGRPDRPWKHGEARENDLVFIGRNLDRAELTEGFRRCLA